MVSRWAGADMRLRAYGIVLSDEPGLRTDADVGAIRTLARRNGMHLCAISVVGSDADLSLLLASFPSSGIGAVLVPSVRQLMGWLDALRAEADVWTVAPRGYWPRRSSGKACSFISASAVN